MNHSNKNLCIFFCGDVMSGRGIDQILPYPGKPQLYESYITFANPCTIFKSMASQNERDVMHFKNRTEAGQLLAQALKKYRNETVVVYALPRGGVTVAIEIARFLHAPLDLIIARKIGHPFQPEYAIAATAENGHIIETRDEVAGLDRTWYANEIEKQRQEAKRRREKYLPNKSEMSVKGKIAILVDDGIATGLTIRLGILELKHRLPKKIVVAVPVAPRTTADLIESEAGEIVALDIPEDCDYLGAVGAYYSDFQAVEDEEVISLMQSNEKEYARYEKNSH